MKTRITVKNRGVKVFDIVEIPGCSDRFRWFFPTGGKVLLKDFERTRSVVYSIGKHRDIVARNGKMPAQKRVENCAYA